MSYKILLVSFPVQFKIEMHWTLEKFSTIKYCSRVNKNKLVYVIILNLLRIFIIQTAIYILNNLFDIIIYEVRFESNGGFFFF